MLVERSYNKHILTDDGTQWTCHRPETKKPTPAPVSYTHLTLVAGVVVMLLANWFFVI